MGRKEFPGRRRFQFASLPHLGVQAMETVMRIVEPCANPQRSVCGDWMVIANREFRGNGFAVVGEEAVGHRRVQQGRDQSPVQTARVASPTFPTGKASLHAAVRSDSETNPQSRGVGSPADDATPMRALAQVAQAVRIGGGGGILGHGDAGSRRLRLWTRSRA